MDDLMNIHIVKCFEFNFVYEAFEVIESAVAIGFHTDVKKRPSGKVLITIYEVKGHV